VKELEARILLINSVIVAVPKGMRELRRAGAIEGVKLRDSQRFQVGHRLY